MQAERFCSVTFDLLRRLVISPSHKQLPTFFFLQRIQACVALILFLLIVMFSL